ncbi:MAG: hypothetical protein ACYDAA_16540 [Syntrophales bacterium]
MNFLKCMRDLRLAGPGADLFRGYQDNTDFGKNLHRQIEAR